MEEILAAEGVPFDLCLPDRHGEVALHFAAVASCPMAAYALAKACPASCLVANQGGKTACDIAKEKNFLEVGPLPWYLRHCTWPRFGEAALLSLFIRITSDMFKELSLSYPHKP